MANNPDIPNTGREQVMPTSFAGSRDRNPRTGYEGVLERGERDKKMEQKVREGRESVQTEEGTTEGGKTTPPLGDEPH